MPRNPACTRCPLGEGTAYRCIWGTGNPNADIVLIGEAPGAEEEREGKPFVGAAGKLLDTILARAGVDRNDVWITNLARCRPPGNRTPTPQEQATCFPYLAEELQAITPKVIVALGGATLKFLTGSQKVAEARGRLLQVKPSIRIGDAALVATYHPAAVLHRGGDPGMIEMITQDIAMAKRTAQPSRDVNHARKLLYPPYTVADVESALLPLQSSKVVAVDCEWTGDSGHMRWPWTPGAELYSIAVSGRVPGTEGVYSIGFAWPPPAGPAIDLIRVVLRDTPSVGHNIMSDLLWLNSVGIVLKLGGDTMLLANLLDEEQGLKLEQLATTLAGVKAGWKIPPRSTRPQTAEEWIKLLDYNCEDAYATLLLIETLHKILRERSDVERKNVLKVYQHLLLPAVPTFVRMAIKGMPIDPELIRDALVKSQKIGTEHATELAKTAGVTVSDAAKIATSDTQALNFLQQQGLVITSTNKDSLSNYDDHPLVKHIQAVRHEQKVSGTYLKPWYSLATTQGDNLLHTIYRLTGARTGRTSAEVEQGGSLQLVPREQRMRDIFRVPEGWKIISVDQSQAELRVAAWFANEQTMLGLYRDGDDLHTATAAFILAFGADKVSVSDFWPRRHDYYKRVSKAARQAAKPANFGFVYGLQAPGFVDYAKSGYNVRLTLKEAEEIREGYFTLYAGLLPWHRQCEEQFYRYGYTVTPFGRYRRHLQDPRKAINCVDYETEVLTSRGWLNGKDLTLQDEILTKNAATGMLEWQSPTGIKHYPDYEGPIVYLKSRSFNAVTTPDHRWLVQRTKQQEKQPFTIDQCVTSEMLRTGGMDRIHRTGDYAGADSPLYEDDFVQLAGWFLTDGHKPKPWTPGTTAIQIFQSLRAHPKKVEEIKELLSRRVSGSNCTVSTQFSEKLQYYTWSISRGDAIALRNLFPERQLTASFLRLLTKNQLRLLMETMLKGDGWLDQSSSPSGTWGFVAGTKTKSDIFSLLCTLNGISTTTKEIQPREGYASPKMSNIAKATKPWYTVSLNHRKFAHIFKAHRTTTHEKIGMWCPMVPNTYFVARREGKTYITGNTPVQSVASDLTMLGILEAQQEISRQSDTAWIGGFVHDSIMAVARADEAQQIAGIIKHAMEHPPLDRFDIDTLPVPLVADIKIGQSWAEAE